jgi:hypothetical protein
MAALLIGFLDRQQSPRATLRLMMVGTVAMALTHLVADSIAGWSLAVLAILVLIAFIEGASIAVHPDAPMVAHFCGTIAATAIIEGPTPGRALQATVAVLVAGAGQILATALSVRFSGQIREFTLVATEIDEIAEALAAMASGPNPVDPDRRAQAVMDAAARHMTTTRRALLRSDLEQRVVELLALVLWAAERVRLEAKALVQAHSAGALPPDVDPGELAPQLRGARATLTRAADALRGKGATRDTALADLLLTTPDRWLRADHMAPALADLVAGTVAVCQERPVRGPGQATGWREWAARSRAAVTRGSLSFLLGRRIALAVLAAMLAATGLGLSHASWASNSVLSVFRPDAGATLSRIAARTIAVTAAGVVVVVVAAAAGGDRAWLFSMVALMMLISYWLGPTNYGIFGFAITVTVLLILAVTGADPLEIAKARWADTVVGCAVAVVVAFMMPVWRIQGLPASVAGLCRDLAAWLTRIGDTVSPAGPGAPSIALPGAGTGAADVTEVRVLGARVRDQVSDNLATFQVARFEPQAGVPVARLRMVFGELRLCAQAALAAENLIVRGWGGTDGHVPERLARNAACDASAIADLIQPTGSNRSPTATLEPNSEVGSPGSLAAALAAAAKHARTARRLVEGELAGSSNPDP